ncbi:MAG TPA: hypothetical protein VIK22_01330 [Candidatus Anoxymicrobiaceae bacterium]
MTSAKRHVEIFIGPIACSCAGGPSPAKQEKITRALALKWALQNEYKAEFDLRVFDLGNEYEYEEGYRMLRQRLEEVGERERAQGAAYALKDLTPAVAVDARLEWIGDAPIIEDFMRRLGRN